MTYITHLLTISLPKSQIIKNLPPNCRQEMLFLNDVGAKKQNDVSNKKYTNTTTSKMNLLINCCISPWIPSKNCETIFLTLLWFDSECEDPLKAKVPLTLSIIYAAKKVFYLLTWLTWIHSWYFLNSHLLLSSINNLTFLVMVLWTLSLLLVEELSIHTKEIFPNLPLNGNDHKNMSFIHINWI